MKLASRFFLVCFFFLTAFSSHDSDNVVDFTCMKVHKASNTCHFNFKIDGVKYRFVDIGCKYNGKEEKVIKKAREGSLALAREWKVECPEPKTSDTKKPSNGF